MTPFTYDRRKRMFIKKKGFEPNIDISHYIIIKANGKEDDSYTVGARRSRASLDMWQTAIDNYLFYGIGRRNTDEIFREKKFDGWYMTPHMRTTLIRRAGGIAKMGELVDKRKSKIKQAYNNGMHMHIPWEKIPDDIGETTEDADLIWKRIQEGYYDDE